MSPSRLLVVAAFGLAFASLASSCSTRGYPFWRVSETEDPDAGVRELKMDRGRPSLYARKLGCATIVAEVVRSGKEGIGILAVDQSPPECPVHLVGAGLRVGGALVATQLQVEPWDARRSAYVGFPFDNEKLWNAGVRTGDLELVIAGASQGAVVFHLYHSYGGAHERTPMGSWPLLVNPELEEHYVFPPDDGTDAGAPPGDAAP